MAVAPKAPRLWTALVLATLFVVALPFIFPDRPVSLLASRLSGYAVRVQGVRWQSLDRLHFAKLVVNGPDGRAWFSSESGEAQISLNGAFKARFLDGHIEKPLLERAFRGALAAFPDGLETKSIELELAKKRIVAADARASIPEALLEKVPADWRSRLPLDEKGRAELRISFENNELTLHGAGGPLLRASWEMV